MDISVYLEMLDRVGPMGSRRYSCSVCLTRLKEKDRALDCADCGAIICETCIRKGAMDEHICEEDEAFEY